MKKFKLIVITLLSIIIIGLIAFLIFNRAIQSKFTKTRTKGISFQVKKITDKPIIEKTIHPKLEKEAEEMGYTNINGPCLIRVPDWVENPLGKYYLYFAHHKGTFLRLAYSDSLTGTWTMHDEEIMPLAESTFATKAQSTSSLLTLSKYNSLSENIALYAVGQAAKKAWEERTQQKMKSSPPTTPHVASPEIIIDHENKQIRLYFHGVIEGRLQKSKVALSTDGIHFKANEEIISLPYLRMFEHQNQYYGLAMPGFFYQSKDGLTDFKVRRNWLFPTNTRHNALYLEGSDLYIFYSKVGDKPERILYTKVDISSKDWNDWKAEPSKELLRSKLDWEGVNEPIVPSIRGEMGVPVHQLRDPYIFKDIDGKRYMLYTGAGEQNIGIVELLTSKQ